MNYLKHIILLLINLCFQQNVLSQSSIDFEAKYSLNLVPINFILGQDEYIISTKDSLISVNVYTGKRTSIPGFNLVVDTSNNSITYINRFGIIQNSNNEEYFYDESDENIKDYVNCVSQKLYSFCFRSFGNVDVYYKNGKGSYDRRLVNYIGNYEIKEGVVSEGIGYAISNIGLISFNLNGSIQVGVLDENPITSLDISKNYIIYSTREGIYFKYISDTNSRFEKIDFDAKSNIIDIKVDEFGSLWVLCADRVYCIYTIESIFRHDFKAEYDQKVLSEKMNGVPMKIEIEDNKFHLITNEGDIYRYNYLTPKIIGTQGRCFYLQGIKFPKQYANFEKLQVKIYKYNPSPKNSVKVCLLNENEKIYSYKSFVLNLE